MKNVPESIRLFFTKQDEAALNDAHKALAEFFSFPLPILVPNDSRWHIVPTKQDMETFARRHCQRLRDHGIVRIEREFISVGQRTTGTGVRCHFRTWYLEADGSCEHHSEVVAYLVPHDDDWSIEMLEYISVTFGEAIIGLKKVSDGDGRNGPRFQ